MKMRPEVEADLRRTIRDARARDPLITTGKIHALLEEKYQRGFSYQYVARLVERVGREALIEVDRTRIEQRMAFTRENYRIARERLLKIVCWTPDPNKPGEKEPGHFTAIEAAKNLVILDLALLKAELECGMYKKTPSELAQSFQYEPLPPETRAVVIAAWIRGGLLREATIREMVLIQDQNPTSQ